MFRALRAAKLVVMASLALPGSALAASAGPDPSTNFPVDQFPAACSAPTSADCTSASLAILDQARAALGQPAYAVPSNFASLTPAEQGFVLANLDRLQYGLAPVTGLTAALDSDAAVGVQQVADPQPAASNYVAWNSNWAGGFPNMPLAYEAWMYDDGPGSGNLDCTSSNTAGCWGHRHGVLYRFDNSGPLAMGAAAGTDPSGQSGYTMLLFEGDSSFRPAFIYTWAQAVAAGAAGGPPAPAATATGPPTSRAAGPPNAVPARVTISVRQRGRRVRILASVPPGGMLACAFTPRGPRGWASDHYRACAASSVMIRRAGRYRLRVRAAGVLLTRFLRIP
ncbi:MAG TPA: hypothetical protein VF781_03230 [Solirubrobacteraceae bacterium]